jgi:arylformamidase
MADAVRRIGWLADHAGELGFDINRLIFVGHSSDAHLVASALHVGTGMSLSGGYASGAYDLI